MAPVARVLAKAQGVLEPIQTATTLAGQIEELKGVLEAYASTPVTLIGYSWGAWLSFMVAARFPALVKKLCLVASGPFEEKYVSALHDTRMSRLTVEERREFEAATQALGDPATPGKDAWLARLGALASKTDAYAPCAAHEDPADRTGPRGDIFQGVWEAAAQLRRSGELLEMAHRIRCPVMAVHGNYDPHPAEGVEKPLAAVLPGFQFVLLEKCGHTPWVERHARDCFYRVIQDAVKEQP